jgi:hypothetical protein
MFTRPDNGLIHRSARGPTSRRGTALNFQDLCPLVPDSLVGGDELATGLSQCGVRASQCQESNEAPGRT